MSRDFSKYDFTKFDPKQKYNLYIDSDTIAYACAAACSKEPCIVTHKASGRKKTFDNFDAFDNFLLNDEKGRPYVNILNNKIQNIEDIDISLSHCKEYAIANVVVIFK